jgi:hypothetical protein
MTYEETYQLVTEELLESNFAALTESDIKTKVVAWAERYCIPEAYALYQMRTNHAFRLNFAKDPKKQNAAEIAAERFLTENLPGCTVVNLPNGGPNAMQVVGGLIIPKSDRNYANAKTVDFRITCPAGNFTVHATHKRTSGDGGAQKNQAKDVENYLDECQRNVDPQDIFAALLDGDYYNDERMKLMRRLYAAEGKIIVCTSDEFVMSVMPTLIQRTS